MDAKNKSYKGTARQVKEVASLFGTESNNISLKRLYPALCQREWQINDYIYI